MKDAAKFWDGAAEKYSRDPIADMAAYEASLTRTKSYLIATDRVLELGCGTGSTALLLAPGVARITGSDLSTNMIAIAKRKATDAGIANVDFRAADLFDPALADGPYDAVLALNLLHLVEDTPGAMARIGGLVKPGGLFISKTVCTFGAGIPFKLRLLLMILPLMQRLGKAPFVKFMQILELERHVTDAGFEILEAGNYPKAPPSRYIVARKTAAGG